MSVNPPGKFSVPEELRVMLFEFTVNYLLEQPGDMYDFAVDFFSKIRDVKHAERSKQVEEQPTSEDSVMSEDEMLTVRFNKRRKSVFAETYDPEEDDDDTVREIFPKSDDQRRRLAESVKNILLFRSLDQEQMNEVIDAMFEKKVSKGETIIEQGEDGDYFYVIQSGTYYALRGAGHEQKVIHTYEDKGSFGELALLYNMPRAATIKAGSEGSLWVMDRVTFRRIVLKSAFRKRKMYEKLIECVPMLKALQPYERMTLSDALLPRAFTDGYRIIKQGDAADGMYFVESGVVSIRVADDTENEVEVKQITKGEYFGELALVTHTKRAASAYAVGVVKAAFLDVEAFERLLGPCMEIMKRNFDDYENQLIKIFGYNPKQEVRHLNSAKRTKKKI